MLNTRTIQTGSYPINILHWIISCRPLISKLQIYRVQHKWNNVTLEKDHMFKKYDNDRYLQILPIIKIFWYWNTQCLSLKRWNYLYEFIWTANISKFLTHRNCTSVHNTLYKYIFIIESLTQHSIHLILPKFR